MSFRNGCSSGGFIAFRAPCSTARLRTIGWDKIHKKVWWMGETRALFDLRFRPKGPSSIPTWRLPQWLFIRGLYSFSHRALKRNRVSQTPSKSFDKCPELKEWQLMTLVHFMSSSSSSFSSEFDWLAQVVWNDHCKLSLPGYLFLT